MIPFNDIQKIFNQVTKSTGVSIIRAEQDGAAPAYPYGAFKIISHAEESFHQNIIENEKSGQNAVKKYYAKQRANVSLNFVGKKYDELLTKVQAVFDWFMKTDNIIYCKKLGHTPRLINPSIQDRTAYLDSMYEYKFGFDIRFDYIGLIEDTIELIDHIEITPKPDGVADQKIIIDL